MKDLLIKMLILGIPRVPRSGQVGVNLAFSWHLKGILKEVKIASVTMPTYGQLDLNLAASGHPWDPQNGKFAKEIFLFVTFALLLLRCLI